MNKHKELREKLVEGLENYMGDKCGIFRQSCFDMKCPYAEKYNCLNAMLKDARELLKPVEPRLVTREDFEQPPAYDGVLPCWKENRKPTRRNGWAAIVYGKALQDMEMGVARYWTGVPTEEQRREMAWPQK